MKDYFPWLAKLPSWLLGAIGFITAIVTFLILFKDNYYLVLVVTAAVLIVSLTISCLYVAFAKTAPLIEGGNGVYRFGNKRYVAMICLVGIILTGIFAFSSKSGRGFITLAFLDKPTETDIARTDQNKYITASISYGYCRNSLVLPYVVSNDTDLQKNISKLAGAFKNDTLDTFSVAPGGAALLDISSISQGQPWIRLGNVFKVSITSIQAPDKIDLAKETSGCGGGSWQYADNEIPLETNFEKYQVRATFSEFDYYSLQPGEYEVFSMQFSCKSPGTYYYAVEIPYSISNKEYVMSVTSPIPIICPIGYSVWDFSSFAFDYDDIEDTLTFNGKYFWNGHE